MTLRIRSSLNGSGPLRRGQPLKKLGPSGVAWRKFRNETFSAECDEEGLIRCQDRLIGLPSCNIARSSEGMDLHHIKGRDGELLFNREMMVWLIRECHEKAHNQ